MRVASKLLISYAICAFIVFVSIVYKSNNNRPDFLYGNDQPIIYADGITFFEGGYDAFKELHTIELHPLGFHTMRSSITSMNDMEIFKKAYSVYFFNDSLFSVKFTDKDDDYTSDQEPDLTESHLIEYPQKEFFQIVFQNKELFCYSSMLTDSVQCVKLIT
ncbi:hypothetical protein [Photobacterium chitinilyticum]|uniref:Uncharacterized protein n=1 Tax=Photobacterium chitinilyticum TaxID=2485123 RepID=A0A3S3UQ13_9GAMM|nr:hypothetical protein [Photobacterium chitinilyticum]RWX57542.1 hypothetical protein EDI28_05865 [Photobacterium chitinilyticum]